MCTVSWDRGGILLVDFLTRDETVNAERYCETLQKLRLAIQNKRQYLVPVLSRCTITLGHTRLDGLHICRSSAAMVIIRARKLRKNPFFILCLKTRPNIICSYTFWIIVGVKTVGFYLSFPPPFDVFLAYWSFFSLFKCLNGLFCNVTFFRLHLYHLYNSIICRV